MAKILVVDPNPVDRALETRELERDGHEVTAAGPAEALAELDSATPDVVVLEIGAPCDTGLGLMAAMTARHREIPVILNTCYSGYRDDFRSWCAAGEVAKSSDALALRHKVRDVLRALETHAA